MNTSREFRAFFSVVLPTRGPLIGVLVILAFLARWNDLLLLRR